MTDPGTSNRGAVHSAQNDTEFPDDERGLTGTHDTAGTPRPEGQTARDVFPEDNGVPDVSQDDFPTMLRSEDPEFAPEPGDRDDHETVSFGTTAFEQQEGEPLSQRLEEEIPDTSADRAPGVRPAEDPDRGLGQLEQDDTTPDSDSGTNRTADGVEASREPVVGGEGPEETAIHVTAG